MKSKNNKTVMTGVSFGAAIHKFKNILEVLNHQIDLIEIPFGARDYFNIVEFAKKHSMNYSLHIPSYEMIEIFPFILDTQTIEQIDQYVQFVSDFLEKQKASELKPSYIVMHFPLISKVEDLTLRKKINQYFLIQMSYCIKKYNIPMLIENVAVDQAFFHGDDYKSILSEADGICFDIGHSHTAEHILKISLSTDLVDEMFTKLSDHIQCIHLYNTVKIPCNDYSPKIHYPFGVINYEQSGFMNEELITARIKKLPNLKYIIYEPHRSQMLKYGSFGSFKHTFLEE